MVLHTNFNNWYHPLVKFQGDPDFDNSYNLQYQQDLARIYETEMFKQAEIKLNYHMMQIY